MLTRGVVAGVLVCGLAQPTAALADTTPAPPIVVHGDTKNGAVDTAVVAPAAPGKATGSGTSNAPGHDDGITCTWTAESAYSQDLMNWLGGTEGTWYDVRCSDGSVTLGVYVPPGNANVPPAVRLAGALAQTAANRLQLPSPQVGRSPAGRALVGLPTWFWVEPSQWRPLRQRTTAGPVWAEVVATPASTTWDPGDGAPPVRCGGAGTPYDRSRPEREQSTDCSYTYWRSSAEQPQTGPDPNDRYFTVTVTTTWRITWTGSAGSGGALVPMLRSTSFPLPVAQRQTVVTGGSDG